jgi:23S rRNA (cytosine1962-C5)-methyltransferase
MSNGYRLLDSGHFRKLEQVGPFRLVRPAASAVWDPSLPEKEWKRFDAEFQRFSDGNGEWKVKNPEIKEPWKIEIAGVQFQMKLTGFGHLGIFAEQEANWIQMRELVRARKPSVDAPVRVLNLFAYTGGSTLFCADAGAEVVHLDASKTSVAWARENAKLSGLEERPVRWIVDDVQEFVDKEVRRGKTYHGIILDPPSYGRGQKNQVWKIEDHLMPLLQNLRKLMAPDFLFMLLSSHSPGYTPVSLENQLRQVCDPDGRGKYVSGEMVIRAETGLALPSGAYSLMKW